MERKPIKIFGNWKDGYAIDLHSISSEYVGDNEYGYSTFDTTRSILGELLYKLNIHTIKR
ncbi:hypothetical protein RBH29_16465 [Herbivorax sp. ANBcel31]|uniref:hypothetical protein n=1 Tax=Herbivorax sp. ANBcel31 TaxID=3069754 RepID=UPI0027AED987|nr:hypothetical protein [Herbivorax sp. ANBcel31]MDQ2088024.1 hypothetical protein [Herbivorax sp. ANBcel31]